MRRSVAAAGSLVFFIVAPGSVAGLVPWWLTRWKVREPFPHWFALRVLGAVLLASGAAVLIRAFVQFVLEGAGTPAPVAPPNHLVVAGLYRYVRNPMYVAIIAAIVGQALMLGQLKLLLYASAVLLVFSAWVVGYEEPTLRRRFGWEYEEYCRAVPAWWPRLRPWTPTDTDRF